MASGERVTLRTACAKLPGWPVGAVRALSTQSGQVEVDDLFAVDLAAVADTATARRGSLGRAVLVASLHRLDRHIDHAALLGDLLGRPVPRVLSEPSAARLAACTTPGPRGDAGGVDAGPGPLAGIAPAGEAVAARAGVPLPPPVSRGA